jgi:iron-sulfur cluster assembly protein
MAAGTLHAENRRELPMLTLTDNAVAVIRNLTEQPQVPEGAGLRIATDDTQGALMLTLAAEPMDGDEVRDEAGARVFLETEAARILDDKSLDAAVDASGAVQFAVGEQPG